MVPRIIYQGDIGEFKQWLRYYPKSIFDVMVTFLYQWLQDEVDNSKLKEYSLLSRAVGGHSIVKLKTMCNGKKSTFYIKDHQNKSICFSFFFTSEYTKYLLHSKKL